MSETKVHFRCHHCHKRLRVGPEHVGKRVNCPKCGGLVLVPDPKAEGVMHTEVSVFSAAAEDEETTWKVAPLPPEDEGPDMTPMVDVVFQLLIFFMVTAAFSLQKSIQVPTPDSQQAAAQSRTIEELEEDDDYIIVKIDRDDTVWVNDSEAPSPQDLLAKLREAREPSGDGKGPSSLLVLASGEAHHEVVVRALDAGSAVGMENVRLASADDEDDY